MKERSTGWELGDLIYQEHQSWVPTGDVSEPHLISQLQVEMGGKGKAIAAKGAACVKAQGSVESVEGSGRHMKFKGSEGN